MLTFKKTIELLKRYNSLTKLIILLIMLPFDGEINTTIIAGSFLWCLALYISFAQLRESIIDRLHSWFNFVINLFYTSKINNQSQESQSVLFASLISILPFLTLGILSNWMVEISLGRNWSISVGILACISCAVYDLGRRDSQGSE